ncbi:MAG: hypothetical protein SGJ20_00785 [Planctomycetota bacterium]|nr:hypothetical protein [Planctomycetota bacterium]
MLIQVFTDKHTKGSTEQSRQIEAVMENALVHFGDRITRVAVYLSDENSSQKFGENDKRCVVEARLAGLQPITVSHRGALLEQAIDGAAAKLRKTLKRSVRRIDSVSKRRTRERAELRAAEPLLKHDVEIGNRKEFIEVLRPLLLCMGSHAWRELRIREASGTLPPDTVTLAGLLDEVVTRAWRQFADRPEWMSLDLWLTKLVDRALEEWIRPVQTVQATARDRGDEILLHGAPRVDDQEWSICLLSGDLSMNEEDGLPSPQSGLAEAHLEAEVIMDSIHRLLGNFPKAQRHAYVLNVLEAYAPADIAMLQGRPEREVRSDINGARDRLRVQMLDGAGSSTPPGILAAASAYER